MGTMNRQQLLDHVFGEVKGIRWSDFGTGCVSSTQAGIYVFANYAANLQSNDTTWPDGDAPTLHRGKTNLAEVMAEIETEMEKDRRTRKIVLYAGRTTSRSLSDRLKDYLYQNQSRCKAEVLEPLRRWPAKIYVHCTVAHHWETGLIQKYSPEFNSSQTRCKLEIPDQCLRWQGRISWQRVRDNPDLVPTQPGLYMFTDANANMHLLRGRRYYVGEADDLQARMKQYKAGRSTRVDEKGFVDKVLKTETPRSIYVRWFEDFIFENEMIRELNPCFNIAAADDD